MVPLVRRHRLLGGCLCKSKSWMAGRRQRHRSEDQLLVERRASRPSSKLSRQPRGWLLSFRMISDTRIECRNANSQGETAQIGPTGTDRGGVEPGGPGSVGVDGFLSSLPQRGPYRPSLRDQPPDVLSLAAPL